MRYLHTMVRVSDLDTSLAFYQQALGMTVVRRSDYDSGRFSLIYLAAEKDLETAKESQAPLLELTYNWDPEDYGEGRNFGHLAFEVDNIYATCEQLIQRGITINRPPRDGRMAFVRSPDNISIEFLQKDGALEIKEPWASMENVGTW